MALTVTSVSAFYPTTCVFYQTREEFLAERLNRWLKENNFECEARHGEVFQYDCADEVIYFGAIPTDDFGTWNDYMEELGLEHNYSLETMAFLHELGHFCTLDDLEDDEILVSQTAKLAIQLEVDAAGIVTKEAYFDYYHLPIEAAATTWAVRYANTCPNVVDKLELYFNL